MAKSHHDLDIYPRPKDQAPLYVNEPWLVDASLLEGVTGEVNIPDDNIRVYVPLDISKDVILVRLQIIIAKYGEANASNEIDFYREVKQLVYQIELYEQVWTARNSADGTDMVVDLVEEFVALLKGIPDGCAEYFPFALIEELEQDYLGDSMCDVELKLDEAEREAALDDIRYSSEEVFGRATKLIHEFKGDSVKDIAENVVKHLKMLPKGTEISTYEAVKALYDEADFEFEDLFEIHFQVNMLAEMEGLYLDPSAYDDQVVGLPYNIPFVIKDLEDKEVGMESIDITDWLRDTYGTDLNPNIGSVCFCQSDDEVWIAIEYNCKTAFGIKSWREYINLDFIAEAYDEPLDIVPEGMSPYEQLTFDPDDDIEENVAKFVTDRETLENTTPLFDK